MKRLRIRLLLRILLWGIGVSSLFMAALFFYLRGDKTEVFHQQAGRLQRGIVLETETTVHATVRRVALENHRGERVAEVFIRRPRVLESDYKILLTYAGLKTRRGILDLIPDRDDLVLVSVQYPYVVPRNLPAKLRWPHSLRRAVYRTVAGGILATEFLARDEDLDLDRLTVMGASLGSPFSVMHGALDERVPRVLIVHGGGDLPAVIRYYYDERDRPLEGIGIALLAEWLVASFDPMRYVDRIAPRELIVIAAEDDLYFPRESTLALYERANQPKKLTWTESGHVRSDNESLIDEIIARVESYLDDPSS